jgi:GNAT superfamily N-acetyltransferase
MAFEIVRLGPEDWERLRRVRLRALRDAPLAFGSTLDETAARPREVWVSQLRELPTWVAATSHADVGLVRGGRDHDAPTRAWLLSMWVAPEARGRGVGDALVRSVVGWARDAGFVELRLEVGDLNAPAIQLYARHGFVPTGATSALPPPREHVTEHERVLPL